MQIVGYDTFWSCRAEPLEKSCLCNQGPLVCLAWYCLHQDGPLVLLLLYVSDDDVNLQILVDSLVYLILGRYS